VANSKERLDAHDDDRGYRSTCCRDGDCADCQHGVRARFRRRVDTLAVSVVVDTLAASGADTSVASVVDVSTASLAGGVWATLADISITVVSAAISIISGALAAVSVSPVRTGTGDTTATTAMGTTVVTSSRRQVTFGCATERKAAAFRFTRSRSKPHQQRLKLKHGPEKWTLVFGKDHAQTTS
jgi:hypothetical protein